MLKRLIVFVLLVGMPFAHGCSGGFDTEEATAVCDETRKAQESCFVDDTFAQCVSCHEECGRECSQLESCPLQFSCD